MRIFLALSLLALSGLSQAAIKTQEIPYQSADGTKMIGYFAYDDAIKGARPGVVVVHEWWGLNEYTKRRARDLAGWATAHWPSTCMAMAKTLSIPRTPWPSCRRVERQCRVQCRFQAGLDLLKNSRKPTRTKSPLSVIASAAAWC